MPPATATRVSLKELADLAIGTPEVGAVNFTALHTLIVAILKNLNLQETLIAFQSPAVEALRATESRSLLSTPQGPAPKEKRRGVGRAPPQALESQVKDLVGQVQDRSKQVKTMDGKMQGIVTHVQRITSQTSGLDVDASTLGEEDKAMLSPQRSQIGSPKVHGSQEGLEDVAMLDPQELQLRSRKVLKDRGKVLKDSREGLKDTEKGLTDSGEVLKGSREGLKDTGKVLKGSREGLKDSRKVLKDTGKVLTDSGEVLEDIIGEVVKDSGEVSPVTAKVLLQDVMEDVKILKEAHQKAQEYFDRPQEILQRIENLEKLITERDEFLEQVGRRLYFVPGGDEVTMVTWEELEQALADGWKSTQRVSETSAVPSRRKTASSLTSSDIAPSGASSKHPSTDQAMDSTGGPYQTLSGPGDTAYPSQEVTSGDQSQGSSAAEFPGGEQHPQARDEAGTPRLQQPPVTQVRAESDRRKKREPRPRRGERDTRPGPAQQDLPSARDQRRYVHPDQHGGVPISRDQDYLRPDNRGLGPPGMDQPGWQQPSIHPYGVQPLHVSQLGMLPPEMDDQGFVPPGMGQHGVMPPLAPGRDQQRLELPSTDRFGMVPLSTHQPGMHASGMGPLGMDQHGLMPVGIDQHGFVIGTDQQGLVPAGIDQHGLRPPLTDQHGLVTHGLRQVSADQQGAVQPSLEASGFIQPGLVQPGADQRGLLQPGADQHGLVQPHSGQPGLVQPGADQQDLVQPSAHQPGLVQPGVGQAGLVQPGTYPPSLAQVAADQHGLVQAGADQGALVQPGADRQGLVQPGIGQPGWAQPGTDQHGLVQPGAYTPGLVQPGVDQAGLVQRGMDQHGLVQPGAYPSGFMQPDAGRLSVMQPGADQSDLVQPGAVQYGLVQPAADQLDVVQPSAYPPGLVQPGIDQHGLVQPGIDWHGLVQPGTDESSLPQPGVDQRGLVPPGAVQGGLVQPGMDQRGMVPLGAVQGGLVQPGVDRHGLVQPSMDQRGLVQPGMDQRGLVQPGAIEGGLVQPGMDQSGLVPPGAVEGGLVQPGMDQRGLAQPSADERGLVPPGAIQGGLVQPGVDQRGLVQPSMDQRGLVQPGMDQRGLVQPGMDQRGLVQPGMDQRGLVQPGAVEGGLVQPGMDQHGLVPPGAVEGGLVQPGMDQHGLVQPGAVQGGLVQPGMDQHGLVQPGVDQRGLVQPGIDQRGVVPPGAVQGGLVQPGVAQRGLVQPGADERVMVPPGAVQGDLVQAGIDQHGLVQPGGDQHGMVQHGAGQFGMVQPGMGQQILLQPSEDPRGLAQPGVYMPGLAQAGAYAPGLVQPGAYPPGLVQPGVSPHGLVQPIPYPHGLVQPGMDQHGLRQPSAGQQGLIARDTELHGFPTFQAGSRSLISPHPYQHGVVPFGQEQRGQVPPFLASQGLVPPATYQQGVMHPGVDQWSSTPLSTGFAHPDQQRLVSPSPDQQGQVYPGADQHGREYTLSAHGGPGIDSHDQVDLDPYRTGASVQPGFPVRMAPGQDRTSSRRQDSLSSLRRASSESSEAQSERRESLEKVTSSFPMALETFRLMGELIGLYAELKENMKDLDKDLAGLTDLEKIQHMLALMVQKTIPPDLQEQLKTLKTLAKEVRQEKAKVEKMHRLLEGYDEHMPGKEPKVSQLGMQLRMLRITVADIEKELAELRESQEQGKATMENSVSEASLYLQDQLDKLRTIIENMLTSSSTLLSMSMIPHKTLTPLAPGQIDPEATCPACSLDLSHQVSILVQRYEQLQDMVSSLAASRPSKKAKLQSQDEELLGHVQSAILQVQGDCEKLNITTSNLIEDHRQKQKDIDVLYQGLEKLEREKADRGHLEMEIEVKADKSALASKVSRVQFTNTTEQLNHMMQELMAKMSGQEQDWQKMLDRILAEMDSKLDRLELDPVKQMLEDRWKSLRQQLKERSPLYQADEAAAMRRAPEAYPGYPLGPGNPSGCGFGPQVREVCLEVGMIKTRQLLAHFHCLSCDRPLETPVTGQAIPVTPVGPGLPGHRSIRPYTVFELEQVRQQSRNLKLGGSFPRGDLSHMEPSVRRLRSMHSKMLMDIEKVQIHFGGSVKASSQMIHELLQARCLGHPCYKRVPDVADYTYSTVPRRCGGSHTLTYPYRRNRLQHLSQGLCPLEEIQIAMKHDEVDILGLDGHIYKGRMDTRLPGILTKDTLGMAKHKPKQPRPHAPRPQAPDSGQLPSRPQSAQMLAGNNPVSSRQQDRPLSSEGRLSQSNVAGPSSATEMAAPQDSLPRLEMVGDMPPREGLEEPTRGPRSTTAH